ncbi:MAG: carboxypeptidase regulatory-like domain-containing protein [Candidatus Aminicenantes bacterium]
MRKFLTIFFVLLLSCSLSAQVRTGTIYGTVTDAEGNVLPGVTVTLTGGQIAPINSITSIKGVYRFLALPPANDYTVKAELEGFKTEVKENIIVVLGANVEINISMAIGTLEEEVTVTATSPVVDTKKTTVQENVTRDVLQSMPSARDPWVVLQQAPGVQVDRENVGGSESGQQAGFMAKGGGSDQWIMDGVVITDPAAMASPSYYDFDAFEEMNITLGGADVTVQSGGIAINLVTRRGGNRTSLGGRFYLTDKKFQATHTGDSIDEVLAQMEQRGYPDSVGYNTIRGVADYGFNAGGPVVKDKVWWWMSYGVQDIRTTNLYGTDDDTMLKNYAAKLNLQLIPQNRLEVFAHIGNKEKWGRSASATWPSGWHQTGANYWGSPIYKIQDEHMFGNNLFLSLKFSYSDAGFNLQPMNDPNQELLSIRDRTTGIWEGGYNALQCTRPMYQYQLVAHYFNDTLFGASHEMKLGVDYAFRSSYSYFNRPGQLFMYKNYPTPQVDMDGDGSRDLVPELWRIRSYRGYFGDASSNSVAAYFSDTITFGRLTLLLGARFDYQDPRINAQIKKSVDPDHPAWKNNFSPAAISAMQGVLPGSEIPEVNPDYEWTTISPRLGITYDITGDGKTIAKLSYANYGEVMNVFGASDFMPGGTGGGVWYWWLDSPTYGGNGNGIVDVTELFWRFYGQRTINQIFDSSGNWLIDPWDAYLWEWSGFDIDNPQQKVDPYITYKGNIGPMRTHEAILTLERELFADFGVALDFNYRHFYNFNWYPDWDGQNDASIDGQHNYVQAGTVPNLTTPWSTGDAAGRPYYLRSPDWQNYQYSIRETRPDYHRTFWSIEARFNKRLSNRWMFNGSLTWQDQRQHFGSSLLNQTNAWAIDGSIWAPNMGGGSGKVSMQVFSHWMAKLSGLYQLPLDFNVSFTFNARQGHPIPRGFYLIDESSPNPASQSVFIYTEKFGTDRLPTFWNFNFRIEKIVRAGDFGRIYLMLDIMNLFNNDMMNRRYDYCYGDYYVDTGFIWNDPYYGLANEVLNPRIFRFGVRFQF